MTLLLIYVVLLFFYSVMSGWVQRTILTAPILFTAAGILLILLSPSTLDLQGLHKPLLLVAEIGLVLLLFTDAARTDLKILNNIRRLPVRLLTTGLLLTIVLGMLGAMIVFGQLTWWEAGILAAILAPTDAGLGQVIVSSPRVPMPIRQALNVEAGLNDGLSVPFLLFFIALAQAGTVGAGPSLMRFVVEQLGVGTLIGLGVGLAGGYLLGLANRRQWMAKSLRQLGVVTLPLLCAILSEELHASMFIAAFVAGLAVQVGYKEAAVHSVEFTEDWGQLFNLFVFFLFGMLAAPLRAHFSFSLLVYAVFSLTVIRMLPVALALTQTGLSKSTVLFMGWFGPRGLASIVLGLVFLEHEARLAGEATIRDAVILTVMLSIFAHGLSALPGIEWYARKIATLGPETPEHKSG